MSVEQPEMEVIANFVDEAGQCLVVLNEKLLVAESGNIDENLVDEMFRAAHSIKGAAGFLDFKNIAKITHSLETVLDNVRHKKLEFKPSVVDALFVAFDTISSLLAVLLTDDQEAIEITEVVAQLNSVLEIDDPGQEQLQDSEQELGEIPVWMQGRLSLDDVLEGLIQRGMGKHLYALLIDLKEIFRRKQDPTAIYRALKQNLHIQSIIPLIANNSIWEPLHTFSYDVGMLVFSELTLSQAISGLPLPAFDAWEILETGLQPEKIHFQQAAVIDIGQPIATLQPKNDMRKHLSLWLNETSEELDQLDAILVTFEKEPESTCYLHEMFRLLHRIKGSSANMGLNAMSRIAHNGESLLEQYRSLGTTPSGKVFEVMFLAKDFLQECLNRIQHDEYTAPSSDKFDQALTEQLFAFPEVEKNGILVKWRFSDKIIEDARLMAGENSNIYLVQITLFPEVSLADLRYGMILRELNDSAEIIFSDPTVRELEQGIDAPPPLQIIVVYARDAESLRACLNVDMVEAIYIEPIGVNSGKPERAVGEQRAAESSQVIAGSMVDTVRVDTARLDQMMNIAGELVISKARVTQLTDTLEKQLHALDLRAIETLIWKEQQGTDRNFSNGNGAGHISIDRLRRLENSIQELVAAQESATLLRDTSLELHRHTSSLQNCVMQARMVPIGPLFQRFQRLVRDVGKERNRKARLVLSGEGTELDKKLIDELTDPLTHLIRNSVDHGLESPEDRIAAGKSEQGTVQLEAYHEGSQICIRITDDGRGLDEARILQKAVTNGIVTEENSRQMSQKEIFQLIFQPGFSTAEKITNISGRGVGMDIVRSKIKELKGQIDIESEAGKGAAFTIRLPLTLAMIEGLLVRIGETKYVFSLESVKEIVEFAPENIFEVHGKGRMIYLRNDAIALVDLCGIMDVDALANSGKSIRAVITRNVGETIAIMVDKVLGKEEVVVKALSQEFKETKGISGATVLGDGGIALILDVLAICGLAKERALGVG